MTTTVLDIYNSALLACNGRGQVSDLNEASRERELCSRFYNLTRDTVQEAAYWPNCRAMQGLAVVTLQAATWVEGAPPMQFYYAYALPADYLRAWHMADYTPFEIGYDSVRDRTVLYSNTESAVLVYARRSDSVAEWTPGQKQSTIYGLAGHIAGALSGRSALIQANFQKANKYLDDARANTMNSENNFFDSLPDWIAARGNSISVSPTRFFYPQGSGFGLNV